ncbi:MAG: holo-ACP synthase [Ignavibacteria bacterium]|nr:holo-ACP synthase [Ignavibacteria bacterium]
MIIGVGIDLIEISRIEQAITQYGEKFISRVFTETERKYCEEYKDKKFLHYAARFAAKEAFSKAIGTGLRQGFKLNQVGIVNGDKGDPRIELFGSLAEKWGKYKIFVSLSHLSSVASAVVIIESNEIQSS